MAEVFSDAPQQLSEPTEKAIGEALAKSIDQRAETILAQFKKSKNDIKIFKDDLRDFVPKIEIEDREPLLFVLVDELDRCRPTYAIQLLERIKHIFDTDGVVFVISTDSAQLRCAICAVYGNDFDAKRYLHRFFDRTYFLPETPILEFVKHSSTKILASSDKIRIIDGYDMSTFLSRFIGSFSLSLRDTKRCIEIIEDFISTWPHKVKIELLVLIPLVVVFQRGNRIPSDDQELFSQISALQKKNAQFTIETPQYNDWGQSRNTDSTNVLSFSNSLYSYAVSIKRCLLDDANNAVHRYCRTIFSEESQILHRGNINVGESVIRRYPEYIMNITSRLDKETGSA